MESSDTSPFSNVDVVLGASDQQSVDYRPLSKAALLSLLMGVLSSVAVFHPVLWVVPLLGLAISLGAIWKFTQHGSEFTGRQMAIAGLLLAIVFGTAAPAKWYTSRQLIVRQSQAFADRWIELVRSGELEFASDFKMTPGFRRLAGMTLDGWYKIAPDAKDAHEMFADDNSVIRLSRMGKAGTVQFVKVLAVIRKNHSDVVRLEYEVSPDATDPFGLVIAVERAINLEQSEDPQWVIRDHGIQPLDTL